MVEKELPLVASAYTLSSGGIGIQRELVKAIMGQREFNTTLEEALEPSIWNNLLGNPIVQGVVRPDCAYGDQYKDYFGALGSEFIERYKNLNVKDKKLSRVILRSSIHDKLTQNDDDFSKEEFSKLMMLLFEKGVNTEELNALYEERTSRSGILIKAIELGIYQSKTRTYDRYEENRKIYLKIPDLKPPLLEFNTEKLDLITDIFYASLKKHKASESTRDDDPDGSYARNWRRLCGEEFPTAYELCRSAKDTVLLARKYLKDIS